MAQREEVVPEITVHHRLRIAREHAGLEQDELAGEIGIARTTVVNYERGHVRQLKSYVLKQWALVCAVSYDWLRGDVDPGMPGGEERGSDQGKRPFVWIDEEAA